MVTQKFARPLVRKTGIAAIAVALSMSMVACSDDAETESDTGNDDATPSASPSTTPSEGESSTGGENDVSFGPACGDIPATGPGSLNGMTVDPVATAAGNNPLLTQLVGAVGIVPGLADQLNSTPDLTVFAPYDPAFEEIPEETMAMLVNDPVESLSPILTYHVIGERLDPDEIVGEHTTLNGGVVNVTGDVESGVSVGETGTEAAVLCGGIQTENATVYVIDSVLMPPAGAPEGS